MKQDDKSKDWLDSIRNKLIDESPLLPLDEDKGWEDLLSKLPKKEESSFWVKFLSFFMLIPAVFFNLKAAWSIIDRAFDRSHNHLKLRVYLPYVSWCVVILLGIVFLYPVRNGVIEYSSSSSLEEGHKWTAKTLVEEKKLSGSAPSSPVSVKSISKAVLSSEPINPYTISEISDHGEDKIVVPDNLEDENHLNSSKSTNQPFSKRRIDSPAIDSSFSVSVSQSSLPKEKQSSRFSLSVDFGIGLTNSALNNGISDTGFMPEDPDGPGSNGENDKPGSSEDDTPDENDHNNINVYKLESNHAKLYDQGEALVHRLPLVVGLQVNYKFSKRFSLQTGLRYSFLYSEGNEKDQRLHMIGIPFDLKADFYKTYRWSFYGGAGIAVDYLAYGVYGGSPIHSHPFTFSMRLKTGASYHFNTKVGVFIEPTVSYVLDNGSEISTYYSEHPFSFALSFGLMFDF
ncbi:MAG: hypothetical protein Q4A76_00960 [Porphyromonadaceae bacterium]|nr:hypothetical protein [Porphyromonadaceae bacterium]